MERDVEKTFVGDDREQSFSKGGWKTSEMGLGSFVTVDVSIAGYS